MFPADPQSWVCPKSNRQCSAKQSARVPFRGITLDTQQKKSSIVPQRLETRHTFHPSPWVYETRLHDRTTHQGATCRASPARADKIPTLVLAANPILWILCMDMGDEPTKIGICLTIPYSCFGGMGGALVLEKPPLWEAGMDRWECLCCRQPRSPIVL